MEGTNGFESCVALLERRIASIPDEVARALALPPPPDTRGLARCQRWITTGVGASEGAARLLALLLRRQGLLAEFAPISTYAGEPPAADVCVIVSHGLSPNARLALAHAGAYARSLLVTTRTAADHPVVAAAEARGTTIVTHGPSEEDGLLLRVVGPACASAAVVGLALHVALHVVRGPGWSDHVGDVPGAIAGAAGRARAALAGLDARALADVAGLVAAGDDVALCDGFRNKLLEGLGRSHPPLWDICGIVHGPLQSFYDKPATLVSLERPPAPLAPLLERVLHPERHRVVHLASTLPGPLAWFDFDAQLDHLLLAALRATPRDLANWPGKGCDGPLYGLGADAVALSPP